MDILEVKILSGIIFFLLALLFGWCPFWIYQRLYGGKRHSKYALRVNQTTKTPKNGVVIQCLHAMASGVLIATCLLHLLPECLDAVREGLNLKFTSSTKSTQPPVGARLLNLSIPEDQLTIKTSDGGSGDAKDESQTDVLGSYPFAELLVAFGFLFVYILDTTIKAARTPSNTEYRSYSFRKLESLDDKHDPIIHSDSESDSEEDIELYSSAEDERKRLFKENLNLKSGTVNSSSVKKNTRNDLSQTHRSIDTSLFDVSNKDNPSRIIPLSESHCRSCINKNVTILRQQLQAELESHELSKLPKTTTNNGCHSEDVQSVALVLALCVHGFFDGVMLGLQTSVSVVMSLLFALSLHKTFVAFSLSLTLVNQMPVSYYGDASDCDSDRKGNSKSSYKSRYFLYVLMFASVAPIGLAASAVFVHSSFVESSQGDSDVSLVPGCLQAFAVGTFLYVSFTETTKRHHGNEITLRSELRGHVSLILGFALMAGLRVVFDDS